MGAAHDCAPLNRLDLRPGSVDGAYNEAWLQRLLHDQPCVLPTEEIEPGFGPLVPLCRELPLRLGGIKSGSLDNLFVTPSGGLMLVEAKLWRNPEARRKVVAQAIDYAAAVFALGYDGLDAAVRRASGGAGLYELVARAHQGVDEAEFVDAVARNLARGRAIVAVVGDGIREDIMPMAELLQSHAGHRFTFALVELAIYDAPMGGRLVLPSILARTALIERGVVRVENAPGQARIVVEEATYRAASPPRGIGIGEDEFYEILDARTPGSAAMLKAFIELADALGVYVDRQGGLNLKHPSPSGPPLNLATITKEGFVDTGPASWWGRNEAALLYNASLAAAIGGTVKDVKEGIQSVLRTADGRTPRLSELLPNHADAWLTAMQRYIETMLAHTETGALETIEGAEAHDR